MNGEEAPDSAFHPFSPWLFLSEAWELFIRARLPLASLWLVSAALQAAAGLAVPGAMVSEGNASQLMFGALAKSFEAVAIYALLCSRHPGAAWTLRQLKPADLLQCSLLLLAVLAVVLALAPILGALTLPLAILLFALASVAPVYVLCDGLAPLAALRASWSLVRPQWARFVPFACLLLAVEQLAALAVDRAFAPLLGQPHLAALLAATADALISSLVAAVFVATVFRLRGPRRSGALRV